MLRGAGFVRKFQRYKQWWDGEKENRYLEPEKEAPGHGCVGAAWSSAKATCGGSPWATFLQGLDCSVTADSLATRN